MENEITIDEVKEFLGKLQLYLGNKASKACLNQMQQKREDIDILDSTAVELAKFSSILLIFSSRITKLSKMLSLTKELWFKVNRIKDEDMKKFEENSEKLFCNTAENFAKEFLNG